MYQRIAHVTLLVRDYDEAIEFYVNKLDFKLIEDTIITKEKRWVVVAPRGAKECALLLAKASDKNQFGCIGNQSGGRVALFLFTDNFDRDYQRYIERGIKFKRPPQSFDYGKVAVFQDLYGNLWDLLEPKPENSGYSMDQ